MLIAARRGLDLGHRRGGVAVTRSRARTCRSRHTRCLVWCGDCDAVVAGEGRVRSWLSGGALGTGLGARGGTTREVRREEVSSHRGGTGAVGVGIGIGGTGGGRTRERGRLLGWDACRHHDGEGEQNSRGSPTRGFYGHPFVSRWTRVHARSTRERSIQVRPEWLLVTCGGREIYLVVHRMGQGRPRE